MASSTTMRSSVQDHARGKPILGDLRSPGWFGTHPLAGLSMFLFGAIVFGALTYNYFARGPLLRWDQMLAVALPAIGLKSPVIVKYLMNAGFHVGKIGVVIIDALLSIYFIAKRYWQELCLVVIGGLGAGLLFRLLSEVIARPRPSTQIWIVVNIPGFPSGHAMSAVLCFGLLAYLLIPRMPSAFWKWLVAAAALFVIIFIGFSRVFTAGHYLTDILSGYAAGIAWMGASFTSIELFFKKRRERNVQRG